MSDVISKMNGEVWIFAAILILFVCVQALLFLRLALNFNKKNKLVSQAEISQSAKTGFVSVFGPSISTIIVALSLITMVGSGATFMRCGVIGAPAWELLMANTAAEAANVTLGTAEVTENIFTMCLFGMILGSAPYFINTIITLKPLDKAVIKANAAAKKEHKESFIPTLGSAAMMGLLGYSIVDYLSSAASIVALIAALVVSYILMQVAKKTGQKWISEWNMAIAMVAGMAVGQIFTSIVG